MNFVLGFWVAILEFVARSRCKFLPGELWSHPNKIFVVFFLLCFHLIMTCYQLIAIIKAPIELLSEYSSSNPNNNSNNSNDNNEKKKSAA